MIRHDIDRIEFFDTIFEDHDRFALPEGIYRVTVGRGGEAILICGGTANALLECGMPCFGRDLVANIKEALALNKERREEGRYSDTVDYILCGHSHYDHIGALPYVLDEWPDAVVCGSAKCKSVFSKEGALRTIFEMGENARKQYTPWNEEPTRIDGFRVDLVIGDGDMIPLSAVIEPDQRLKGKDPFSYELDAEAEEGCSGNCSSCSACGSCSGAEDWGPEYDEPDGISFIDVLETKGHTDCCLSFGLQPINMLFTSESTGVIDRIDRCETPMLKGYYQSMESCEKCRMYYADIICLTHFGLLPKYFNEKYWEVFEDSLNTANDWVIEWYENGDSDEEVCRKYVEKYWDEGRAEVQPLKAFELNAKYIVKALYKDWLTEQE